MVSVNFNITGGPEVARALRAAWPNKPKRQRQVLNAAIKAAAKPTILDKAKITAMFSAGSGSLSQAMNSRVMSLKFAREQGATAGVWIGPVRKDPAAIAKYINHYWLGRGKKINPSIFTYGLRHAHLVEFGHDIVVGGAKGKGGKVVGRVSAKPFMRPALHAGAGSYKRLLVPTLKKKILSAVRREARRARKK